ncbi:MAG TPA: FxsA family protein [Casimicrobiaceae bacterium]|mgnify:CR=1 FL=1|nr:FxsA family protein [Casimicrobiaceae bacterium]
MRFLAAAIVLSFPVLDLLATTRFARWTGLSVWIWLAVGLCAGLALLRNERGAFHTRTVAAMHGEASILRDLLDSGRKVLAGLLFLLPGIVSDLAGLGLLLLPINTGLRTQPAGRGAAIDGVSRRID